MFVDMWGTYNSNKGGALAKIPINYYQIDELNY